MEAFLLFLFFLETMERQLAKGTQTKTMARRTNGLSRELWTIAYAANGKQRHRTDTFSFHRTVRMHFSNTEDNDVVQSMPW